MRNRAATGVRTCCWLLIATAAPSLLGACMTPPPRATPARLAIIAEPPETRVFVNDRYLAKARALAIKPADLPPGVKFITFTADGYFPHDLQVKLPPGTTTIRIKLRPIPK